ncbi:hypothetical protein [Streptomyces sp. NRRL WC-3618]|uniref:hypothetical protein n=1 Tax=Streptomyces sp. NRRL WC-3618 TaxID=1519490 RepID=UPI00131C8519|nr:hypothetical protein [Streptomyces sp. NRRL WC-3618]
MRLDGVDAVMRLDGFDGVTRLDGFDGVDGVDGQGFRNHRPDLVVDVADGRPVALDVLPGIAHWRESFPDFRPPSERASARTSRLRTRRRPHHRHTAHRHAAHLLMARSGRGPGA